MESLAVWNGRQTAYLQNPHRWQSVGFWGTVVILLFQNFSTIAKNTIWWKNIGNFCLGIPMLFEYTDHNRDNYKCD